MKLFLEWLTELSADTDLSKAGFQASWVYVAWNVFFPAVFGVSVAGLINLIDKLRKKGDKPC